MNKTNHILLALVLMFVALSAKAFENGQTIRLVNSGKSILVENSSLDENKNAVLWTETNVNSQRWTLNATTKGTFLLSNDYTGYYLGGLTSGMSGNVGQVSKTNANSKGSWEFVPVEGTANQYIIYQGTTRKYALAAAATVTEGSALTIVNTQATTPVAAERITWTVEVVQQMEQAFTTDKRDAMMEGFKAKHYKKQSTGYSIDKGGFWGDAEMFETVLDALETTGDQQYATMFDNLYNNFLARNGSDWTSTGQGWPRSNEYNDDIAWICIACTRGYMLTGQTKYRTTAKSNFDKMYKRANCYGNNLLQWKAYDNNTKEGTNACINGPAVICACYLAIATADMSYYDKAIKTYAAHRDLLYEKSNGTVTGKVFDSGNAVKLTVGNQWASTYNQGTSLGAAILLYKHTGDEMYRKDADAINNWSKKNLANSRGIINACQTVAGDLCGFKGILFRYLRLYAEELDHPENYEWMAKNAYHAWNNRNSSGITSSAWLTKAEENFKHQEGNDLKTFEAFGNSTCLSAAFNCHLGAVDKHDAYAVNQAEHFNFVRNAQVSDSGNTDDGSGQVYASKSAQQIGYRNVNFGSKPASHIDLRLLISGSTTTIGNASGINVFIDEPNTTKGTQLCAIRGTDLEALKAWGTVHKELNVPVTGQHKVYFVSYGSGQTTINWWQFKSENPVYADLTNQNGLLTASLSTEGIEALTDGDITTAYTAAMEPGQTAWVQYRSPSPILVRGYQFFSGSDASGDPKGWQLQASCDGKQWETLHTATDTTFNVRAQRYYADLKAEKAYTHYRLLFDCNDTQKQLSVSEWQLIGRGIIDTDLTSEGGSITDGMSALIDHVGTTIVPAPITAIYHAASNDRLDAYSITIDQAATAPTAWKLEGSANGTTWKAIDQQTEVTFPFNGCTATYRVKPDATYLYYRLTIAGEGEISQWQLFGTPDFGTYYADVTEIATIRSCDGSPSISLIDNDGTTAATITGDSLYWDIQTPVDVKPVGISFVAADDAELDPQTILFYGYDETGEATILSTRVLTFPARYARLTYTVSSTKLFKHFALIIPEGSKARLADFELYGAAIADAEPCYNAPEKVETTAAAVATTEDISKLYDKSRISCYHANFTEPVSITYSFGKPVSVNTYGITASKNEPTRDPADWTLQGSNDGTTWTTIDSRTGEAFSHRYATQFYFCQEPAAYSTYRLTVSATAGANQIQIGELQLLTLNEDLVTEISTPTLQTPTATDAIYDLSGRKLPQGAKLSKGLYIQGGRLRLSEE